MEKNMFYNEGCSLGLSVIEKKIKLKDCNLEEYKKTISRSYLETSVLKSFFKDKSIFIVAEDCPAYTHNLLQFNMSSFFASEGFSKECDFSIKDEEFITQSRKSQVQYDNDKFFDAYFEAYLFYKNKKNKKICVKIDKRYSANTFYYEFFSTEEDCDLLLRWKKYSKENNFYKGKKINADCSFLQLDSDIKWDDIILEPSIKTVIQNNIEKLFSVSEILKKNSIQLKRGIILSGCPGTGKTLVCKVLSKELKTTVLYVLPTHIQNRSDIATICDMAKDLAPTLLILEDIDYIAEDRESQNGWAVIDLMNKMDGLEGFDNVITLATTNLITKVENAIKNRPGRFDRVITLSVPSCELKLKMFKKFTENFILDSDVDFNKIAKKTDKLSGAYIKDLCITAALIALYDDSLSKKQIIIVKQKHFTEALIEINNKDFSQATSNRPDRPMGFGTNIDNNGETY